MAEGSVSAAAAAHSLVGDGNVEPTDSAVSTDGDGTWMKRGFSSVYGVQTTIAWDSGKVIDVEIL